jgi:hypothetical protein
MRYAGFVNGSGQTRSRNVDDERTINLYQERADAGTPTSKGALYWTPGVKPFAGLGAGPVRALFEQNGRVFAVGGSGLYEILPNRSSVLRGTMAVDGNPATISGNGTNGHQLLITSGGLGYIFDTEDDTFEQITDDGFPFPVAMGVFIDTYFLVLKSASNQFNWSAPLDGLDWDATDVAQTSLSSDRKFAIAVSHRYVYVFGSKYTEVWQNTAGSSTFEPVPGTFIEHGIDSPYSIATLDNTLFWVGKDENGPRLVWMLQGHTPIRVSSHSVEYWLMRAPTMSQVRGFAYQEQGHGVYWLYIPGLDTSWVYDVATQQWHERAHWDPKLIRFIPHVAQNHCYAFNRHLVGDRQSRVVYEMNLNFLHDELVIGAGE